MTYRYIRYLNKKINKLILNHQYKKIIDILRKNKYILNDKFYEFKICFLMKLFRRYISFNIKLYCQSDIVVKINRNCDIRIKIKYFVGVIKQDLECYTNIIIINDTVNQKVKYKVKYEAINGELKKVKII